MHISPTATLNTHADSWDIYGWLHVSQHSTVLLTRWLTCVPSTSHFSLSWPAASMHIQGGRSFRPVKNRRGENNQQTISITLLHGLHTPAHFSCYKLKLFVHSTTQISPWLVINRWLLLKRPAGISAEGLWSNAEFGNFGTWMSPAVWPIEATGPCCSH